MIEEIPKHTTTVLMWQEPKSSDSLGEPALKLTKYSDRLSIQQGSKGILVTLECVPEFIKAIKTIMGKP